MKKKLTLLLTAVIIVLLLSGLLIFFTLNPKKDDLQIDEIVDDESVLLWDYTEDMFTEIHVENEKGFFDIIPDGNGGFEIPELTKLPENTLAYNSVNSLSELTAFKVIDENPNDIGQYGLEKPKAKIEMAFSDGTEKIILIGDNAAKVAHSYIKIDGEDAVYIIDEAYISVSAKDKMDFVSLNLTGIADDPANIDVKKIVYGGSELDEEIVVESTTETEENSFMSAGLVITSPINIDVDMEKVEVVDKSAVMITADSVVEIFPTDESLAEYGLVEPSHTMDINYVHMKTGEDDKLIYEDGSYKILVGSQNKDSGAYYVMREGTDVVYEVSLMYLPWIKFSVVDISSKIQFLPHIETISSIIVKTAEDEFVFDLEFSQEESNTSGDSDEESEKALNVAENGESVDTEQFRNLYQLLLGAMGEDVLDTDSVDLSEVETYLSITYKFVDKAEDDTVVELVPVDDRTFAISVDGVMIYTIRQSYARALLENCEKLLDGGEVSSSWT